MKKLATGILLLSSISMAGCTARQAEPKQHKLAHKGLTYNQCMAGYDSFADEEMLEPANISDEIVQRLECGRRANVLNQ